MTLPFNPFKCGDFLAGGGGWTYAMKQIPELNCRWVLNHDKTAIRTNMFNNRGIKHYWADFYRQNEHEMEQVDYAHASVECDSHCKANGGKIKKIGSYMMGWELVRYLKYLDLHLLSIENVPEFKNWGPVRIIEDVENSTATYSALMMEDGEYVYKAIKERQGEYFEAWKKTICDLGYDYSEKIMNAADYGLPTRRVRYFAWFSRTSLNMQIEWPAQTHNKNGTDGLKKWIACRKYIDLKKEGESIFGREFNPNISKGHRRPLKPNSLRRVAGGVKKFSPEVYFIMQYYGTGDNVQKISSPLNTIPTVDRHALIKLEKIQFIQDYCRKDIYVDPTEPLNAQVTWQTKQLVTLLKKQFVSDSTFSTEAKNYSVDDPINNLTSQQRHQLFSSHFISVQNNSNGKPEANNFSASDPLWATTQIEKFQFISTYFNAGGNPESQNQSIESPLNTVLTETNKKALITAIQNGLVDFDIKMRFLEPEELSLISTFPKSYFTNKRLKLSKKAATRLIGNAVPPEWARLIMQPVMKELRRALEEKHLAA